MRGVYIAYAVVTWAYFGVAFTGYWAYGSNVESNILFSLEHPKGVIALASAMGTMSQPFAALHLMPFHIITLPAVRLCLSVTYDAITCIKEECTPNQLSHIQGPTHFVTHR